MSSWADLSSWRLVLLLAAMRYPGDVRLGRQISTDQRLRRCLGGAGSLWSRKACRLQTLRHFQAVEWDKSWLGFLMQLEPTNPPNAG
jgi:hypothetical protein